MNQTEKQLHFTVQYIAAAAKLYTETKEDDSHTNLAWLEDSNVFQSWPFLNGSFLELDTIEFKLNWKGPTESTFDLLGSSHADVLQWLTEITKIQNLKPFVFDLHYSLDSGSIDNQFVYAQINKEYALKLAKYRSLAKSACERAIANKNFKTDVRTWPHHFDTGAFVQLPQSEIGIGFGMAVPDTNSKDYYLYVSGYKGHDALSTKNLASLTKGKWEDGNWKGAMLSVENLDSSDSLQFFIEAIDSLSSK